MTKQLLAHALALTVLIGSAPACGSDGDAPTSTADVRTDGGGLPDASGGDEWPARPPLARTTTRLLQAEELAVFLPRLDEATLAWIWDDEAEDGVDDSGGEEIRPELGTLGTDAADGRLLDSHSADIDGDGEDERDATLAQFDGWFAPAPPKPLATVGETGAGGTEVFLEIGSEQTSAEQRSLGVETSAGFKVGGVGVEASVGVTNTSIYEISVAEATEYAGSVGDIATIDFTDHEYAFGMFVYNFVRDDGVKYQVIHWAVR